MYVEWDPCTGAKGRTVVHSLAASQIESLKAHNDKQPSVDVGKLDSLITTALSRLQLTEGQNRNETENKQTTAW